MKRLAKETAVYGLSSIIGRFLNWMLVPMYTRVLTDTSDYGIVTNLYGWTALLLILLTYGMETGFFRFINKKEETEPMRVYASVLYCLMASSTLFVLLVFLFLPQISGGLGYAEHPEYVGMMAGIVAVDAFCCVPFAYLRYLGKAWRFAGIKLLSIFLNIALNILFLVVCPWLHTHAPASVDWFYHEGYGVGYIFVANVFTTLLTLVLLFPDILPGLRAKVNLPTLRQILAYSFPILLLGIAGIFNQTADKILFPFLFDDKDYANEQLGIYGACFKIAVVMVMFTQAFRYLRALYLRPQQERRQQEGLFGSDEILHHLRIIDLPGRDVLHRHPEIFRRTGLLPRFTGRTDRDAGRAVLRDLFQPLLVVQAHGPDL